MVGLAAPAVGPAPASRDASSFVIFSISVVHCPAAAVPMGKATKAQAPSSKVVVFMALLPVASESRVCGFPPFDMNQDSKRTFRAALGTLRPPRPLRQDRRGEADILRCAWRCAPEAAKRIAKTRRADADPISQGKNGPLTRLWRQDALNMRRAAPQICSVRRWRKAPTPRVTVLCQRRQQWRAAVPGQQRIPTSRTCSAPFLDGTVIEPLAIPAVGDAAVLRPTVRTSLS